MCSKATSELLWVERILRDRRITAIQNANFVFRFELTNILTLNPWKFWRVTKPHQTHMVTLSNDLGEIVNDSECANIFNNEFSSVFTTEPEFQFPIQPSIIQSAMLTITFIADGITSIIENMKLSSSTGADEINSKFI